MYLFSFGSEAGLWPGVKKYPEFYIKWFLLSRLCLSWSKEMMELFAIDDKLTTLCCTE